MNSEDCYAAEAPGGPAGQAVEQEPLKLHQVLLQPEHVLDEIVLS